MAETDYTVIARALSDVGRAFNTALTGKFERERLEAERKRKGKAFADAVAAGTPPGDAPMLSFGDLPGDLMNALALDPESVQAYNEMQEKSRPQYRQFGQSPALYQVPASGAPPSPVPGINIGKSLGEMDDNELSYIAGREDDPRAVDAAAIVEQRLFDRLYEYGEKERLKAKDKFQNVPIQTPDGKTVYGSLQTGADGTVKVVMTNAAVPPKAGSGTASAKLQDHLAQLSSIESNLAEYEELLTKVPGGRIGGTASKVAGAIEMNDEARAATGMENTLAGLVARVINREVGVMTDQDIERAKTMIPKILDNKDERKLKFDIIRRLIADRRRAAQTAGQQPAKPKFEIEAIE